MNSFIVSRKIFGISMEISLNNQQAYNIINHEFQNYPIGDRPEITINQIDNFETGVLSSNPKTHSETDEGFIIRTLLIDIHFKFKNNEITEIDFLIHEKPGLRKYLRKWANMQFTNRSENIGQILHETILVPLMLMRSDRMITHSSAVQNQNQRAILFGGTGGVGKTSIEIDLCLNRKFKFVADDIAVIDNIGVVFVNLNYPKIYAYNLEVNAELRKQIFKNRRFGDKMQWKVKKNMGLNKVRRKIDPSELYNLPKQDNMPTENYYFLFRSNTSKIEIEEVDPEKANLFSGLVIKDEYDFIYNHIRWHEYNRKVMGLNPFVTEKIIDDKMDELGSSFFNQTKTFLINVPDSLSHKDFLAQLPEYLKAL